MQPRLVRSRTDSMLTGVCGGLGEYFNIDPVIVRLIFVLVTMTSGLGIPIYIILLIVMPRGTATQGEYSQQTFVPHGQHSSQEARHSAAQLGQEAPRFGQELQEAMPAQSYQQTQRQRLGKSGTLSQEPPPPSEYKFDPKTGQPLWPGHPTTGETINLRVDASEMPSQFTPSSGIQQSTLVSPRRRRSWSTLGLILIGIGGLILLEQIGISMTFVFPTLLILAGIILLRRR